MNGRIYELMITVITNITNTVLGAWYDLIGTFAMQFYLSSVHTPHRPCQLDLSTCLAGILIRCRAIFIHPRLCISKTLSYTTR
jgi:hypothetical protein